MGVIDTALADLRTLDELAARPTALSRIDPRAKLLVTLAFVLAVVSFEPHAVSALLPLAVFPVAMAALGEVPAGAVLRKVLVAAPLAVMVGLANPWLDTAPWPVAGGVTLAAGWWSFASIVLRFVLTVSAAMVLVGGTGMMALCAGLARLGVPRVFTTQLLLLWRFAFVLGEEAQRVGTARALRALGRRPTLADYGPLAGQLLLRATSRAQRVHEALQSRRFDGELRTGRELRWRGADSVFLAGWCALFAALRMADLPRGLGVWLMGAA